MMKITRRIVTYLRIIDILFVFVQSDKQRHSLTRTCTTRLFPLSIKRSKLVMDTIKSEGEISVKLISI